MSSEQLEHWDETYKKNMSYFGESPSIFCLRCIDAMKAQGCRSILELGAGQGRDTKYLVETGASVMAIDYSGVSCGQLRQRFGDKVTVVQADVLHGIDLPDATVDACYSHMLFNMDFTDDQLIAVMRDIGRTVVPGGLIMLSVRIQSDSAFGKGENLHDDVWKNNGFAVRFYTEKAIASLTEGFEQISMQEFNEGQKMLCGIILRNTVH